MAKLTAAQRAKLTSSQFALRKIRKFPIHDKGHAQSAVAYAKKGYAHKTLSKGQANTVLKKVNARYRMNVKLIR